MALPAFLFHPNSPKKQSVMTQAIKFPTFVFVLFISAGLMVHAQTPQMTVKRTNSAVSVTDLQNALYVQTGQPSDENGIHSQYYIDFPTYTSQGADDFEVPAGPGWLVDSVWVSGYYSPGGGPATKAHVYFYNDQNGMPGSQVHFFFAAPVTSDDNGKLGVSLDPPLELPEGHYWVSVQPVMSYSQTGQWMWDKESSPTIGQEYYWRNPGGGFGIPGSQNWLMASQIDWGYGPQEDLNLSFAIYGQPAGIPPVISSISENTAYPGQSIRINGEHFGEFAAGSALQIDDSAYVDGITYWSDEEIIFTLPDLGNGEVEFSVIAAPDLVSNQVALNIQRVSTAFFLVPNENDVLSGNEVRLAAAGNVDQDLITFAVFSYRPVNSTTWSVIGTDNDGANRHYSTTQSMGSGEGWSVLWDLTNIPDADVQLRVLMIDQYGHTMTGYRNVRIDKSPLRPKFHPGNSENIAGKALDNDSLYFELEVTDPQTTQLSLGWEPVSYPQGGWQYERNLLQVDQFAIPFTDRFGNDVRSAACGPTAMAGCLKWIAQQYPGSETAGMTAETLALRLAVTADLGSDGIRGDNLVYAAQKLLGGDPGIDDDFDVKIHFNRQDASNSFYHNVYDDITHGLRDSADVLMLIYQVGPGGDTVGHYVTAVSHRVDFSYQAGENGILKQATDYVGFMDPATGEITEKIIIPSGDAPVIEDYQLVPNAGSAAWVHSVITLRPKTTAAAPNAANDIAQVAVNGIGTYRLAAPASAFTDGVQILQISGMTTDDNTAGLYTTGVIGPYQPVAYFKTETTTMITGVPVQFTDFSAPAGSITGWQWNFGDGQVSADQHPQHSYSQTGTYDVRLVVSDGSSSDTLIRENYISIVGATEQQIALAPGWHGISSFVEPADTEIENILAPIVDQLIILQDPEGFYFPAQGVNTLGAWNSRQGYMIKISQPATLQVRGLDAADPALELPAGWSLLPVLSACEVDVADIASQCGGSLIILKDIAGVKMYWPPAGISTLETLVPGNAYLIKLSEPTSITFPVCP